MLNLEKFSFENRHLIHQMFGCSSFRTLNQVLDRFLIENEPSDLTDLQKERLLAQIWLQEISRNTKTQRVISCDSPYLEDLIKKITERYDLELDLKNINYLKISSPRQDYYDSIQSESCKRLAFLSKIICATKDFSYSYSEKDHAKDSAYIASRVAKEFNLSSHSIYHIKTVALDHSFGEFALGKSAGDAFQKVLAKYDILNSDFDFSHHQNVLRHLVRQDASFARIEVASNIVVPKNAVDLSEEEILQNHPKEIRNLFKKITKIGILNGPRGVYLKNFPVIEGQMMGWSDGISWISNDLKLLLKLKIRDIKSLSQELQGVFAQIYKITLEQNQGESSKFIDRFIANFREFLIADYCREITRKIQNNQQLQQSFLENPGNIRFAEDFCAGGLSDEVARQVDLLVDILVGDLYGSLLYTKGCDKPSSKKQFWLELLDLIVAKISEFNKNNILLPHFYQNLLDKEIDYVLSRAYREDLSRDQNILIATVKFLGIRLGDRELLRLCDIVMRYDGSNLKEYFANHKDKMQDISDFDELIDEF